MRKKDEFITKVDAHVGRKIVEIRLAFGLTRNDVASKVGVTHQQFSKYERGENRMPIGRLIQVAAVFCKPPSYFYEEITQKVETPEDESRQRLTLEYSKNFKGIKNESIKETINKLVAVLNKCS